jgi:hypothetical protein
MPAPPHSLHVLLMRWCWQMLHGSDRGAAGGGGDGRARGGADAGHAGGGCQHQRIRSKCKEFGGASICKPRSLESQCKECGGASICPQGAFQPLGSRPSSCAASTSPSAHQRAEPRQVGGRGPAWRGGRPAARQLERPAGASSRSSTTSIGIGTAKAALAVGPHCHFEPSCSWGIRWSALKDRSRSADELYAWAEAGRCSGSSGRRRTEPRTAPRSPPHSSACAACARFRGGPGACHPSAAAVRGEYSPGASRLRVGPLSAHSAMDLAPISGC